MEWSTIVNLIDAQLLIVVATCWALGYMIKQTPSVPDWSIVYIVTAFAIVLVVMLTGFSAQAVLQGILCGATAVYGNQLIKQTAIGKQAVADKKQADKVESKPIVEPAKVEQPKQEEKPVEAIPTPAEPVEEPKPVKQAFTVVKQADVSKPASTTAEFVVSENGTISVKGDIPPYADSVTAAVLPVGKKALTFKADEKLHWLILGMDEAVDKMAIIGIGTMNNNIANITASTKAMAFKAGYTKVDLDETHVFTSGKEYKVVNNDADVELYYKDGDTFKLWYRVLKEDIQLSNGENMVWLTPRLGAVIGISEADKTNNNVFVEAKIEGVSHE